MFSKIVNKIRSLYKDYKMYYTQTHDRLFAIAWGRHTTH